MADGWSTLGRFVEPLPPPFSERAVVQSLPRRGDRRSPAEATLEVELTSPAVELTVPECGLVRELGAQCEREVAETRNALAGLGYELAALLPVEGATPPVTPEWRATDRRSWRYAGGRLWVEGTRTRVVDALQGYAGASDAHLVREHLRLIAAQRAECLRAVFREIAKAAGG
jgi:uncharacterized protein (DUF433 family)